MAIVVEAARRLLDRRDNMPHMPEAPQMGEREARTRLRAIDHMIQLIDARIPDESLAAKPYEWSATEARDVRRIVRGGAPLTAVGREAFALAREEFGE